MFGDGLAELVRLVAPCCAGDDAFAVDPIDELALPPTFDPAAEFVLAPGEEFALPAKFDPAAEFMLAPDDEFALSDLFDPVDVFVLPSLLDPAFVFPAFELAFELAGEPSRADAFLLLFAVV